MRTEGIGSWNFLEVMLKALQSEIIQIHLLQHVPSKSLTRCCVVHSDDNARKILWQMFPEEAVAYPIHFGKKPVQSKTTGMFAGSSAEQIANAVSPIAQLLTTRGQRNLLLCCQRGTRRKDLTLDLLLSKG